MTSCLETINGGLTTTIQDFGRIGSQALGVPVAGALDPVMLRVANALVGNPENYGALEIRILGPTFRVLAKSVRVALAGTKTSFQIIEPKPESVPSHQSLKLTHGQVFRIKKTPDTACCYLAVEGGFDVPDVYGSQSTYFFGGFGGFEGRPLKRGDQVPLFLDEIAKRQEKIATDTLEYEETGPIRVVLGPQADYFTERGHATFLEGEYKISNDSNRMGIRAEGPPIEHARGYNIISDGITTGSIQVPGTGLPIILLADHQTTGGYPKIGTVISADLRRLGRMKPGSVLRFEAVDVAEAERLRRLQEKQVQQLIAAIQPISDDIV